MARGSRTRIKTIEESISENVTEQSPAEVETTGPETINGIIVNALHVNARREPSLESDPVDVLDRGEVVEVLEKRKYFWKIRTSKDRIAYISSAFIEEDRSWTRT